MSYDQPGYGVTPQKAPHPQSTTILVLGILSLICCGVLGPVAWIMGNKALAEVAAGQYGASTNLTVGRILGMVATALMVIGFVGYILLFTFGAANS